MIRYLFKAVGVMWRHARVSMSLRCLVAIVMALLTPIALLLTQNLVDSVAAFQMAGHDAILLWGGLLILSMFFLSAAGYLEQLQKIQMKRQLDQNLSPQILQKYQRIQYACFEDAENQDLLKQVGDAPQDLILTTFEDFIAMIAAAIRIGGMVLLYGQVSWTLPAVFLVMIPLMIWLDYRAMRMMNDMFASQSVDERWQDYYARLLSDKHALFELKVFGAVGYIVSLWETRNDKVLQERLRTTIKSQYYTFWGTIVLICWVCVLMVAVLRGFLNDVITLGIFVSLLGSAGGLLESSVALSSVSSNVIRHCLRTQFLEKFMALPEQETMTEDGLAVAVSQNDAFRQANSPTIEFEDVHFRYPKASEEVLKGVSFRIEAGQHIALVGENGAGKTTLIKLLCKLYQPDSGVIRLNGVDLRDVEDKDLRQMLCVVFQDYGCYQLTLRENVALSSVGRMFEDEELWQALKRSRADGIASRLDVNLGKLEEDGIDLSGGQWQRLAIARALFSDSAFVVLDEPTAALDPMVESEMYHSFADVLKSRGSIVISHRLASARMADEILVLKEGVVSERGSHEALLLRGGIYQQMWQMQSAWYTEGKET